jgi:hypothetical protein
LIENASGDKEKRKPKLVKEKNKEEKNLFGDTRVDAAAINTEENHENHEALFL